MSEKSKTLYLVERTDNVFWEEYRSLVVRAETREEAFEIAEETGTSCWGGESDFTKEHTKITEISNKGKSEVILSDYNAG